MINQREKRYFDLIQNLLTSSREEISILLQNNQDIIDVNLVQIAQRMLDISRERQQDHLVTAFDKLIEMLIFLLEKQVDVVHFIEGDTTEFLMYILQVAEKSSNPQTLYSVLNINLDRVNLELVDTLQDWSSQTLSKLNIEQRQKISLDIFNLSNLIQGFPFKRSEVLELAIAGYKIVEKHFNRENHSGMWANTQINLANCYAQRIRGSRVKNIENAITIYQFALQIYTKEYFPRGWAKIQSNLASAYSERILGEQAQNIEDAINTYRLALLVQTRKRFPEQWANTQMNLAKTYAKRIRGERTKNIEYAIGTFKLALKVYTQEDYPDDWGIININLSAVYMMRIRGEKIKNIKSSISHLDLALQVFSRDGFPEKWAMIQGNLATLYAQNISEGSPLDIKAAISTYKLVLQVYTKDQFREKWAQTQTNLANAYSECITTESLLELEQAIFAYQQALDVYKPHTFPKECRATSRSLANLYRYKQCWQDSCIYYQLALTATENLYQASISRFGQEAELKETNDLYRRAAYAHAKTNDLKRAVEILEQGRARGLSETLQRDRANLDQIKAETPELFNRYQTAANILRNLESIERSQQLTNENWSQSNADQATQTRADLKTCITEIRKIPGYETFLALPTFADITQSLQPNRPLIYLTTTPSGSLALILTPTNTEPTIKAIWLDNLNESDLIKLLNEQWLPASRNMSEDFPNWLNTIDTITRQLWGQIMEPIVDHLETHSITQATLIPTGYLSLLPLHAAWTADPNNTKTGRRYACDNICFTYAPNALSLQTAQAIAKNTPVSNLLAIDNPTQDLANSAAEVATATSTFPDTFTFAHDKATRAAVLAAIPHHSVLHFSCHGTANFSEPLKSGLAMADREILSLSDLFDLKLDGVRLALLSACETSLPGTELPDEVVSLPTGLLQAGVAGIAASLWSVSDLSTMLLLTRFYEFWRTDHLEPAEALCQAQRWLREATSQEKALHFQASHPDLFQQLILLPPDHFAHPFHWAAFSYTGI